MLSQLGVSVVVVNVPSCFLFFLVVHHVSFFFLACFLKLFTHYDPLMKDSF